MLPCRTVLHPEAPVRRWVTAVFIIERSLPGLCILSPAEEKQSRKRPLSGGNSKQRALQGAFKCPLPRSAPRLRAVARWRPAGDVPRALLRLKLAAAMFGLSVGSLGRTARY